MFAPGAWGDELRRALRLLPFMPLGGKGKFSLVEGEVASATYRFLDANPKVPGATLVFSKTTGSGVTFADGAAGVDFTVVIDKADLDPLFEQRYYHDLTVVKANADPLVVSTGDFYLTAGAPALI